MARVLVIHGDRSARRFIATRASVRHEVSTEESFGGAMKALQQVRPDVVVVGLDPKRPEALDLLRYLSRNRIDVPAVVVGPAKTGAMQPMLMKLGAFSFVEYPMEQSALDRAISKALQSDKEAHGTVPTICAEEQGANLSELEQHLNRHMVCFAGKNQVFIQSTILGGGATTKPRIALKCALRKQFGHSPNVYYEYIRDVCCGDPTACPAHQEFKARHSA